MLLLQLLTPCPGIAYGKLYCTRKCFAAAAAAAAHTWFNNSLVTERVVHKIVLLLHVLCSNNSDFLVLHMVDDAGWGTRNRIAGPFSLTQQESDPTSVLQHSLELNSARALSLNSCHQEAVDKFRALDASGMGLAAVGVGIPRSGVRAPA